MAKNAIKNGLIRLTSGDEASAADEKGRDERIQALAYFRALKRDFAPGHELDDWLAAEQELDAQANRD